MGLDVRVPLGVMFAIMGALLAGYGIAGDQSIYTRSLGINVNAIWGGVMIGFAAVLLVLASRHARAARGGGRG
jgi:hypothetical protein